VSGIKKKTRDMGKEDKFLKMEAYMMGNGLIISIMVEGN